MEYFVARPAGGAVYNQFVSKSFDRRVVVRYTQKSSILSNGRNAN